MDLGVHQPAEEASSLATDLHPLMPQQDEVVDDANGESGQKPFTAITEKDVSDTTLKMESQSWKPGAVVIFLMVLMIAAAPLFLVRAFLFSRTQKSGNLPWPDCT